MLKEICSTCNGKGNINRNTLSVKFYCSSRNILQKALVKTDVEDIYKFVDDNGKAFYCHVRFPENHHPLSETERRTLG